MRNKLFFLVVLFTVFCSCKEAPSITNVNNSTKDSISNNNSIEDLLNNLNNPTSNKIMVISHRGDWRNAPENSLQAIQNCIDLGVDMVEIDVRKTNDNQLVVIHDSKLDRTTTGKGLVKEWTLDSLKTLRLKNGTGRPTHHRIPTLREALLIAKGKILINLDKCYDYFDDAYKIIEETGTTKQVVIKGYNKSVEDVQRDFGNKLDSIIFMPIIHLDKQKNAKSILFDYQNKIKPLAFEIVFSQDTSSVLNEFSEIKNNGSKVWVNSLWKSLNAGYEDDIALNNRDSIYGWYVDKGVNMIQTDRPALLLKYLRSKGLHD
ncbi:glycerophosphodiester phosphodiesterase family protein [Winogradskyella schleiferi]|uniref:glycerophosphodiester phosphodiesterase family protein n=1 Tax=Winogradskyella schleiferi TaxID=2686078 RepID=UPI0015BD1F11|nr:glycerophosphodiester phosphodiesterase family protein [Winogradskyella schleiferi]